MDADTCFYSFIIDASGSHKILSGDSDGLEYNDFFVIFSACQFSFDHLSQVTCEIILRDRAVFQRDQDVAGFRQDSFFGVKIKFGRVRISGSISCI